MSIKIKNQYWNDAYLLSLKDKGALGHYDSHIIGNQKFNEFVAVNNIVAEYDGGSQYIQWLLGVRGFGRHFYDKYKIPYGDHTHAYKTKNGDKIVTTQPYALNDEKIKEITDWCNALELDVEIKSPDESWHYNGHTWIVIIRKMGV